MKRLKTVVTNPQEKYSGVLRMAIQSIDNRLLLLGNHCLFPPCNIEMLVQRVSPMLHY